MQGKIEEMEEVGEGEDRTLKTKVFGGEWGRCLLTD